MAESEITSGKWLTVEFVKNDLDVHVATVRRWIKSGELPAVKMGNKAGYRIWSEDYDRFLAERFTKKAAA